MNQNLEIEEEKEELIDRCGDFDGFSERVVLETFTICWKKMVLAHYLPFDRPYKRMGLNGSSWWWEFRQCYVTSSCGLSIAKDAQTCSSLFCSMLMTCDEV